MYETFKSMIDDKEHRLAINTHSNTIYISFYINSYEIFNHSIYFDNKNFSFQKTKPSILIKKIIELTIRNKCKFSTKWQEGYETEIVEQKIVQLLLDIDKYLTKELLEDLDNVYEYKLNNELLVLEKEYENIDLVLEKRLKNLQKAIDKAKKNNEKRKAFLPKKIEKTKNRNARIAKAKI